MSTCRSCQAEVEWAKTESGKSMPLDANPVENGNLVVVSQVATTYGMAPVVRYVKAGAGNRVSHFATCPERDEHRKNQ